MVPFHIIIFIAYDFLWFAAKSDNSDFCRRLSIDGREHASRTGSEVHRYICHNGSEAVISRYRLGHDHAHRNSSVTFPLHKRHCVRDIISLYHERICLHNSGVLLGSPDATFLEGWVPHQIVDIGHFQCHWVQDSGGIFPLDIIFAPVTSNPLGPDGHYWPGS